MTSTPPPEPEPHHNPQGSVPPPLPPQTTHSESRIPPGIPGVSAPPRKGFFGALFDFSFSNFITRKIAWIFYLFQLIVIGITALVWFFILLIGGFAGMGDSVGVGLLSVLAALVLVPIAAFAAVILARIWVELMIALVVVAENTRSLRRD